MLKVEVNESGPTFGRGAYISRQIDDWLAGVFPAQGRSPARCSSFACLTPLTWRFGWSSTMLFSGAGTPGVTFEHWC